MNDSLNKLFGTASSLGQSALGFVQYLLNLFMSNPLWFLGGLLLFRVTQKGAKFNIKDLLGIKL